MVHQCKPSGFTCRPCLKISILHCKQLITTLSLLLLFRGGYFCALHTFILPSLRTMIFVHGAVAVPKNNSRRVYVQLNGEKKKNRVLGRRLISMSIFIIIK